MSRRESFYLLLLFIAPFFFLCGTLTSSQTFFARDLTYLFHPWRTLAAQMLQEGKMPLWNSYEMGGMPFLANCQSAILYPFTIFFFIFQFVNALKLFHFFHYALSGIGFYLFSRKIGAGAWIAFLGGIVFAYNGYMLTRFEFLSVLGAALWLPWIFLPITIPLSSCGSMLFPALFCAIAISCSLFAGFPQLLILQLLAAISFSCLFHAPRKNIIFWLMTGSIALWMGAVQWIPTLELLPRSIRGGSGVSFKEAAIYSLPTESLFGLIVPYRILHHADRFTGEKYFWIWSGWWGVAATLFIFFSIRSRQRKLLFFSWGLFAAGILWSLGNQLPWFETLYKNFFLLRLFRYPPVALYWTVAAAASLVTSGLAVIRRQIFNNNLKRGAAIVLSLFLVLELWSYSRKIAPTVIPDYYHITSPAIQNILNDKTGTVMLSPKLDRERHLAGITSLETKLKFRAFLFDLTNLPYRIKTIVPSGEPLALAAYENLHDELMSTHSLKEARPLLNLWNVTHFLTQDTLDNSWELASQDPTIKVYRNSQALGEAYALEAHSRIQKSIQPVFLKTGAQEIAATFTSDKELFVHFNVPYYPGWKIFCSDCKVHRSKPLLSFPVRNYFMGIALPPGTHKLFLSYEPSSWKVALPVTLIAIAVLAVGLPFRKLIFTMRRD